MIHVGIPTGIGGGPSESAGMGQLYIDAAGYPALDRAAIDLAGLFSGDPNLAAINKR